MLAIAAQYDIDDCYFYEVIFVYCYCFEVLCSKIYLFYLIFCAMKLSLCGLFLYRYFLLSRSCFSVNFWILARMFFSLFLAKDISPSSVNINKTPENLAIESHDTNSNRRFVAIQNKGLTSSQSSPALHKEYYNSNEQIPTSGGDEETYDDAISMGKKGFFVSSIANFCLHPFAFSISIFKWPCSRSGTFMWYGNHVV